MAILFDQQKTGSGNVATSLWVDLGVISSGFKYRLGIGNLGSLMKSITFDIRTNKLTKSAGTLTDTTSIASYAVGPKTKPNPYALDCYKNNSLAKYTVVGSGTEHWWLLLTAKGASAAFNYQINYMLV
jgi:hypothetical protein